MVRNTRRRIATAACYAPTYKCPPISILIVRELDSGWYRCEASAYVSQVILLAARLMGRAWGVSLVRGPQLQLVMPRRISALRYLYRWSDASIPVDIDVKHVFTLVNSS
jgi:hypothetical protein